MGYLLKEALKTLCGINQWCYAVFWKIGCQNPRLLIWEECYYEPIIFSSAAHGVHDSNKIDLLVTKMMKDNYINLLGEGLVGRVAFTWNHQWIILDHKMVDVHPPEVSNEVYMQFLAGIQTIAVIPVNPHGVVLLGSSLTIMENIGFVNDVKSLISQLGCVPGALLSENYMKNEGSLNTNPTKHSELISLGNSVSAHSFSLGRHIGDHQVTNLYGRDPEHDKQFGSFSASHYPLRTMEKRGLSDAFSGDRDHVNNNMVSEKEKMEHEISQALMMSSEEACLKPPSRDDLFDIVGMDFKTKLFSGSRNNTDSSVLELQGVVSDQFSVYEGESDICSDDLLDAIVSKVHSSSKKISDDNVSCWTSITKTSSSFSPIAYRSSIWANWEMDLTPKKLIGVQNSLKKVGSMDSYSYKPGISKEDGGNISDTSSIISSQISSWTDVRKTSVIASEQAKKADEISKSNRKRLKPGENPRPRPKDRQMIQDRVKELREIVPNGAKCSIDALLERTIKHMLFLQNVTKHADKIKQIGEPKIVGNDGGLLLRDNFEGGATWAYEVGSGSMVCPIIVEDLNLPRQMLVEMLCEERGSFLEIADVIKGLGLTILKGVMESHNDKIWAHFTVEANRDVTRMEIFISLVSLFDQTAKNGAAAAERSFHHVTATNPTTVGPHSMQ